MKLIVITAATLGLASCAGGGASAPEPNDTCGASDYQGLVGQNRSEIPQQPAGATWRVACTTCPVTQDYRPDRMNIYFDDASGIIEEVKCG